MLCAAHGLLEVKRFSSSSVSAAVGAGDVYVTGKWFIRLDVHCA